eukprot:GHVN01041638.1.p2 GENE.GHVN01041638.1~~GHVN01041638.1.p2  ORF type:complete len:115 (+),score=21.27 GHVN01041638.1:1365-1709(+)
MTVPLKVKVAQQEMMIRFCLVPSFPYYLCIGLRDMMKVPHIRGALFSVFKLNNWKGIDETRSDEALLNEGKEQLRRLTGTDDAVMFEKQGIEGRQLELKRWGRLAKEGGGRSLL